MINGPKFEKNFLFMTNRWAKMDKFDPYGIPYQD